MPVRRLPIGARVLLGPLRYMVVLFVLQFLPVLLVAPLALDVIGLGAGRLPSVATSDTHFKVIDGIFSYCPMKEGRTAFLAEKRLYCALLFVRDSKPRIENDQN